MVVFSLRSIMLKRCSHGRKKLCFSFFLPCRKQEAEEETCTFYVLRTGCIPSLTSSVSPLLPRRRLYSYANEPPCLFVNVNHRFLLYCVRAADQLSGFTGAGRNFTLAVFRCTNTLPCDWHSCHIGNITHTHTHKNARATATQVAQEEEAKRRWTLSSHSTQQLDTV